MDPSLTASRARIQASEEPLGQSRWAGGTLRDSGRRLEGMGVGRQSRRAEDVPTLHLICPGSVGMVGQCLREGRLQMGVARQTDSSWT